MAFAESEAIARAALAGATDPQIAPSERAKHALRIIDAVDPQATLSVDADLPTDPEGIERLGLRDLLGVAQHMGIEVPSPSEIPA